MLVLFPSGCARRPRVISVYPQLGLYRLPRNVIPVSGFCRVVGWAGSGDYLAGIPLRSAYIRSLVADYLGTCLFAESLILC